MSKPKILTDIENKIDKDSIINDLTTGGADKVASAETVKILNTNKADKIIGSEFTGDIFKITGDSYKTYTIKYLSNVTNAPTNNINDWCILEYIPFENTKKFKITPFTSTYNGITQEAVVSLDGLTVYTSWTIIPTNRQIEHKTDNMIMSNRITTEEIAANKGFLIKTDMPFANAKSFFIEIKGNTYVGGNFPINTLLQGYIYFDTVYTYKAINLGNSIPAINIFNLNGKICLWIAYNIYFAGLQVKATYDVKEYGGNFKNLVTEITIETKPTGITQEVVCVPKQVATTEKVDISSCLLNNWINSHSSFPLTLTISGNQATINGYIKNGIATRNTTLFTLPDGILASASRFLPAYQHTSPVITRTIRIDNNSPNIKIDNNYDWVDGEYLLNFSFPIQ